jgi:hypothetical protein
LNIGRYVSGHPKPYMQKQQIEDETGDNKSGKIINIAFNMSASGEISGQEMFNKGATIAALIELLERAGKRVELKGRMSSTGHDKAKPNFRYQVMIKEAGEPIDVDRIAFALAHPGCLRRLGFSIMEQASEKIQRAIGIGEWGSGYGMPTEWQERDIHREYKPRRIRVHASRMDQETISGSRDNLGGLNPSRYPREI